MPHAIVEWTSNLKGEADIHGLLQLIAKRMGQTNGVFPLGGIRVRGIELTDYVIADDSGQDAFVNITFKIGAGRPADFKTQFFGALFEDVAAHFGDLFERRYLALSMYVEEFEDGASFKKNNLHKRFQKAS
ncbi:5-carboxymethyl-2-hydroxymuconate isomerase [Caulobacter sp. AP07]|uniref:5-carboxymethyl-2-hydroxymuconate Delta-isomerase n=1 Tax=Caulobacter sp. AP07 TaxID=1144304 RepID=UPI000271E8CB|nr:5-carboxymethyl-2-hydroxymuconate Delta-isomerase [Caulobacter sp. AP07]EJL30774.1 5-carboxymethyl-2-hydroxymuconate isomerase [Caulobacter sp. AP07]